MAVHRLPQPQPKRIAPPCCAGLGTRSLNHLTRTRSTASSAHEGICRRQNAPRTVALKQPRTMQVKLPTPWTKSMKTIAALCPCGLSDQLPCGVFLRRVTSARFRGQSVLKYAPKLTELKGLPNKVRYSQPGEGGIDSLLAIGAGEDDF
jgi:hypothetical protein